MADHRSFGRPPRAGVCREAPYREAPYREEPPREAPPREALEHFDPDPFFPEGPYFPEPYFPEPFFPERRGVPAPPAKLRGRLLVAALAVGACVGAALSGDQVAHSGPGAPPAAVQQLPR